MSSKKKGRTFSDLLDDDQEADSGASAGVTQDMAHRMLEMNPAMRSGHSTESLVEAMKAIKGGARGPDPRSASIQQEIQEVGREHERVSRSVSASRDIYGAVLAAKREIADRMQAQGSKLELELEGVEEELQLLEHRAQMRQSEVEELMTQVKPREQALGRDALHALLDQLLALDPDMVTAKTRQTLQKEKAFLDMLGFSVKKLLDRQREREGEP